MPLSGSATTVANRLQHSQVRNTAPTADGTRSNRAAISNLATRTCRGQPRASLAAVPPGTSTCPSGCRQTARADPLGRSPQPPSQAHTGRGAAEPAGADADRRDEPAAGTAARKVPGGETHRAVVRSGVREAAYFSASTCSVNRSFTAKPLSPAIHRAYCCQSRGHRATFHERRNHDQTRVAHGGCQSGHAQCPREAAVLQSADRQEEGHVPWVACWAG